MALINCPKCGKEISDRGRICPHCRTWLNEVSIPIAQKPNKVYLILGFAFLIIAIALLFLGLCLFSVGGIIFVILALPLFNVALFSFNKHKKAVYKYHLANTDYISYKKYIKEENEKEKATQELAQNQKKAEVAKKYNYYKYKCPMCGSNKIINISTVKKAVSVEFFGLASNKLGKTYQCDECKYMW